MRRDGGRPKPKPKYRGAAAPLSGTQHVRAAPGKSAAQLQRESEARRVRQKEIYAANVSAFVPAALVRPPGKVVRQPPKGKPGGRPPTAREAYRQEVERERLRVGWARRAVVKPKAREALRATETPAERRARIPPPPGRDTSFLGALTRTPGEILGRWERGGRVAGRLAQAVAEPVGQDIRMLFHPTEFIPTATGRSRAPVPLTAPPGTERGTIRRGLFPGSRALVPLIETPEIGKAVQGKPYSKFWAGVEVAGLWPGIPKGTSAAIKAAKEAPELLVPEREAAHAVIKATMKAKDAKRNLENMDAAVYTEVKRLPKEEQPARAAEMYSNYRAELAKTPALDVSSLRGVVAPKRFQADTHATEVLDRYVPEMVPGQKAPKIAGLPKTITSRADFSQLLDDMAGRLEAGLEFARNWYRNSGREILDSTGGDVDRADRVAQLVAIYSPQKPVAPNIAQALRVLADWEAGAGVRIGNRSQRKLARQALRGENWLANVRPNQLPKVRRFYANLLKHIDESRLAEHGFTGREVTVDGWMGAAYGHGFNTSTKGLTEAQFRLIEDTVQHLADHYGIAPEEAQAAIWTSIKAERDVSTAALYADPATRLEALERAGQSFADAMFSPKNTLRLPFESMSPEKQWLSDYPLETQIAHTSEYGNAALRVLHDHGLIARRDEGGISFWRNPDTGKIEANPQTAVELALGDRPVTRMRGKEVVEQTARGLYLRIPASTREFADGLAAAIGSAAKQRQSGWARYLNARGNESDVTAYRLEAGRSLTQDEAIRLNAALPEGMHYSAGANGGIIAMNNPEPLLDRSIKAQAALRAGRKQESRAIRRELTVLAQTRRAQVDAALAAALPDAKIRVADLAHRGRLIDDGEYRALLSRGRRSDLLQRIHRDLTDAFDTVDGHFRANPVAATRRANEYPGSLSLPRPGFRQRVGAGLEQIRQEQRQVGIVPPWMRPRRPIAEPATTIAPVEVPPRAIPEAVEETAEEAADRARMEAAAQVRKTVRGSAEARREQAYKNAEERAARARAGEEAMLGLEGAEALTAGLKALRGEFPKINWGGFDDLTPEAWEAMTKHVQGHPDLLFYEKIRAFNALTKMVNGRVPQPNEVKLLYRAFGKEPVDAMKKERTKLQKLARAGIELYHLPRALMSTWDISYLLRQGLIAGVRHPVMSARAFRDSLRMWKSEEVFDKAMLEIVEDPDYVYMKRHGVDFTDLGDEFSKREEVSLSTWAEYAPLVRRSNRAYAGFLNLQRKHLFKAALDVTRRELTAAGKTIDDPEAYEILDSFAKLTNSATGRGEFGRSEFMKTAQRFSQYFLFSPRLVASRLNFLNPVWYAQLHPLARKEALKQFGLTLAAVGTTSMLIKMAADNLGFKASIELDPRDPDFAKVRIGDTRIDLLGGLQQPFRYAAQIVDQTYDLVRQHQEGGQTATGYGFKTPGSTFLRFWRSKLAPVPSFITDAAFNKDFLGQPIDYKRAMVERMVPILWSDLYDLRKDGYDIRQALFYPPALFGVGVQTYPEKKEEEKGGDEWWKGGGGEGEEWWKGGGEEDEWWK